MISGRVSGLSDAEIAQRVDGVASPQDLYERIKQDGHRICRKCGTTYVDDTHCEAVGETPEKRGRQGRSSGPIEELPPASNAIDLFQERLAALMRANEELKHRKESRQGRHYPYRTVSRKTPSDSEWDDHAKLLGLESVARDHLYFGGGVISRGTSSPAPHSPLPELIGVYLLAGGAVEPLVEALHDDPGSANWSEINKRIEGRKSGPEKLDGLKAVASQLAILIRGGTLSRGNPPPGESSHKLNLNHRITVRREAGVPDKQIYGDLLVGLGLSEEQFPWDDFRRLADLGLKLP
ncbi:MAG TPA: hypothetical protein VNA27_14465 [Rubrobacteraceae bacterium]|nr:hypothetical protein [Rubrobacteraceae bacterium]